MRILLVGAGGVGGAAAAIAARRDFVECLVVADHDLARVEAVVERVGDPRLVAVRLDATDEGAVEDTLAAHRATALLNATDPRFVMPLFRAALAAGATYLDMAMSSPATRPTTCSRTSTSSGCATVRTCGWTATSSRRRSRSGR